MNKSRNNNKHKNNQSSSFTELQIREVFLADTATTGTDDIEKRLENNNKCLVSDLPSKH